MSGMAPVLRRACGRLLHVEARGREVFVVADARDLGDRYRGMVARHMAQSSGLARAIAERVPVLIEQGYEPEHALRAAELYALAARRWAARRAHRRAA